MRGGATDFNPPARATKASAWLLAAAIAGAALAVGTVHTITLCIVAAVLAAAALLSGWNGEPVRARPAASLLFATGTVLTAYTTLQCVPMPIGWLAKIAPHNADIWSRALVPLREAGPGWAPISVDPIATRIEALKGVTYLLAFVAALRIARKREGASFLGATIVVTGLALAATALLHPAFGARKLYGVWTPSMDFGRHLAPFLNPNNLAGYLNVAFCLSLAAALAPEPRVSRPILLACALTLAATQVWVASRGGVLAMLLGAGLVFVLVRAGRTRQRQTLASISVVLGVCAAAGAFMVVLAQSEGASAELFVTETSKIQLFVEAMRMAPSFPVFGTGRGAFETAFPAFCHLVGYATYEYPENVVAQWLIEWGVPVGVGGLAAVAIGLRPNSVLARSSIAAGAWAALVAVGVQSLVDLGSEIPGLMLACVVCAAIVVGGVAGRDTRSHLGRWSTAPRPVAIAGAGAAACAIASAGLGAGYEVAQDRRSLYALVADGRPSTEQVASAVRAAILRHPAEPYLPLVAAMRMMGEPHGNPIAWIGATLERAPIYAPAHLLLARVVAARSPSQARFEYRLAMEQSLDLLPTVVAEVPSVVGRYDDAMEVIPTGKGAGWVLEHLVASLQPRMPATCSRLDLEIKTRAPAEPGPLLRATGDLIEDLVADGGAPWCENDGRRSCLDQALDDAKRAEDLAPEGCESHLLRARAEVLGGKIAEGLDGLLRAADMVRASDERARCLQSLETMAFEAHDEHRATEAISKIANLGCAEAPECGRNLAWVAGAEERRGNLQRALALYRRAHEQVPESDGVLESIGRLAATAGLHAESAEAFGLLARRHPGEPRWSTTASSERAAAAKAALNL